MAVKKYIILTLLSLIAIPTYSQFEYKMGVNLTFGGFKTIGYKTGEDDYTPMQMGNYKPGITADFGLQYNINRKFSMAVHAGIMKTWGWSYKIDGVDWMYYEILDTITYEILEDGLNELNFFNFSIGLTPKYYFSPGAKWSPYLSAGINFNLSKAYYANNVWYDEKMLGLLAPEDTEPYNPYLEHNAGLGFTPGFGIEYNTGSKYNLAFEAGYSLILMKEENFEDPFFSENFNAIYLKVGLRFNFLKSKNL